MKQDKINETSSSGKLCIDCIYYRLINDAPRCLFPDEPELVDDICLSFKYNRMNNKSET